MRVLYVATPEATKSSSSGYFRPWSLSDDYTLRSSLREFVLVPHERAKNARIDPSQPWVAGMYWQRSDGAISPGNAKLVEWKALGLASPVLVIAGKAAGNTALRDKQALKLRVLIGKAGFDPDDAPVVSATSIDATFRESLLRALDEQAQKVSTVEKARRLERVTDTLDALVVHERDDAMVLTLSKAMQGLRSARASERARVLLAIEQFVVRSPEHSSRVMTSVLRYNVAFSRESLTAMIAAQIAGSGKLPARLQEWLQRWRLSEGDATGLTRVLRAAIDADPKSERSLALTEMIALEGLLLA